MPAVIIRPILKRLLAPAPEAITRGQTPRYAPNLAVRFGYWATETDGSKVKTGEFQDLDPSPFWDIDGLFSDGRKTLDLYGTGLDQEANPLTGAECFDPATDTWSTIADMHMPRSMFGSAVGSDGRATSTSIGW